MSEDNKKTPGERSLDDLLAAFVDTEEDFRDRSEGGEGEEEEEEETEETEEEELERERIKALTSAGTTNVFNTPGRETEIMKELFRADRLKDKEKK